MLFRFYELMCLSIDKQSKHEYLNHCKCYEYSSMKKYLKGKGEWYILQGHCLKACEIDDANL